MSSEQPAPADFTPEINAHNGALDTELTAALRALSAAAQEEDGHPPFSDQTLVTLSSEATSPDQLSTFLAFDGDELVGAAVIERGSRTMELVVAPTARGYGVATALLNAISEHALTDPGLRDLQAWAHGNNDGAARLAAEFGFAPARELWRMRLSTHGTAQPRHPEAARPDYRIRTFDPATDKQAWLAANAAAFADHPEQGSMTLDDLNARISEDWFNPAGFFVAVAAGESGSNHAAESAGESQPEILGFHWTKIHPGQDGHPDMGEIYALGVVPGAQGTGLGTALSEAGLDYLHAKTGDAIMLYVEADNEPAINLYRKLGFTRWDADVLYAPRGKTS